MAVRCVECGRLSRDETVCEWCRKAIPVDARIPAKEGGFAAPGAAEHESGAEMASETAEARIPAATSDLSPDAPPLKVEDVSRAEAAAVASAVPEERRAEDEAAEIVEAEETASDTGERQDRDTLVILLLILLQLGLTLYLGRLSSWWSITGILWLVVGYGVKERYSWSLALPLVLFTLDVAMLLFGVGPREEAGFFVLAPLDFFLYLLRLVIWALIWRLRDEMA